MSHLAAIVGPTGVGKSRLGIHLARTFDGEIVNADSQQLYRYMDIGTAKPDADELHLVPHHLFSIINPDEEISVARYQEMAYKTIDEILSRGRLPILVGGSGLYVWSVVEGWQIPRVPPDPDLRRNLEERASQFGVATLYAELAGIDPVAAQRINPGNVRRIIRALEVYQKTQQPISQLQQKKAPPFDTLLIGLTMDRDELYSRLDGRVDEMIAQGLVKEVEKLFEMGYTSSMPALASIGYKQIAQHIKGELTLEEAIQQIKYENHRLVRHQYNWFRLSDNRIRWFDINRSLESEIDRVVAGFLGGEIA